MTYNLKYTVHYKNSEPLVKNGAACFGAYMGSNRFGDNNDKKLAGITYYPNHLAGGLPKEKVLEYYSLLLNELNIGEYLDGYPTAESILNDGLFVSSEISSTEVLVILTLFRYVDEFPKIVSSYLTIRHIGNLSEAKYLEWAHKVSSSGGFYGLDQNHALFNDKLTSWCDGDLMDIFDNHWDENLPHGDPESNRAWISDVYRNSKYENDSALSAISGSITPGQSDFSMISKMHSAIETLERLDNSVSGVDTIENFPTDLMPGEFKVALQPSPIQTKNWQKVARDKAWGKVG